MNDFDLSIQEGKVMAGSTDIPMLIVGEQRDLWFRGNNLTAFLEYAQPRVALTKILKTRNTKTFAELLPQVVSNMVNPCGRSKSQICQRARLVQTNCMVNHGESRVLSGLGV